MIIGIIIGFFAGCIGSQVILCTLLGLMPWQVVAELRKEAKP